MQARASIVPKPCSRNRLPLYGMRKLQRKAISCSAISAASPTTTTVGFCGVGIMGLAMAQNLLKSGYQVVVWNRSADKCQSLVELGAKIAKTPADVAKQATLTFGMLADPKAALDVACGSEGIASGMCAGHGYVDVSTVDAGTSSEIAHAVRARGGLYLEAPVSGSKGPAEQGKLIFLAAGDRELFDAAEHPLSVMGKASFFLGDVGAGANMKLVVNMVMGSMMASFAEGMQLAEKAGLSKQDLVDVIALGAIAAPMYAMKGPAMMKGTYPTAFPLKHQQKDLRLALGLGNQLGQPLPVAAAANDLYVRAMGLGHADDDFSAVLEAVLLRQQQTPQ